MKKSGLAIHCHHNILIDYCYDYDERVEVIKNNKPQNEHGIRLCLFKILPDEALKDLPIKLQKAYAERKKADAEREKADAEWEKKDKDIFHHKWCSCKYWDGQEIVF